MTNTRASEMHVDASTESGDRREEELTYTFTNLLRKLLHILPLQPQCWDSHLQISILRLGRPCQRPVYGRVINTGLFRQQLGDVRAVDVEGVEGRVSVWFLGDGGKADLLEGRGDVGDGEGMIGRVGIHGD